MSNCLVLQGKNFIAIGADTASSILIDGKYRRIGTDAKKLYRFGNEIMFCSGRMALVELVTSNIVMKDNKIVLNSLTDFIKSLSIQKADTYDLEVLICGVENNKSYMHQISQYNDFEVKTVTNDTSGCAVYSTGFNAKTMLDTTKKNYGLCKNISDLFIKSFTDISSDEVGGYINMYLVQENQITKCVDSQKVDDVESISVSNDNIHFVIADCLIGDMIIGETLLVANSTGTFIVDKDGIIVKNMKLDMSNEDGTSRIVIDPNLSSIFSIYNKDDKVFFIDGTGNVKINGGSIFTENGDTYVSINKQGDNVFEIGAYIHTGEIPEWEENTQGLNLTNYTTGSNGYNHHFSQFSFMNINDDTYFISEFKIKKYDYVGKTWKTIYDFSDESFASIVSEYQPLYKYNQFFVKNDYNDNNLYIILTPHCLNPYANYNNNFTCYLCKFDTINNVFSILNALCTNDTELYTPVYNCKYSDAIIINNILYIDSNEDYMPLSCLYYEITGDGSALYQNIWGSYSWGYNWSCGSYPINNNSFTFISYLYKNNELYAITNDRNNHNLYYFVKVLDIKNRKIETIHEIVHSGTDYMCYIDSGSISTTTYGHDYATNICLFGHNKQIYLIGCFHENPKYWVYDENVITEYNNLPSLELYFSNIYSNPDVGGIYVNGVGFFSNNGLIHCYNCKLKNNETISHYTFKGVDIDYIVKPVFTIDNMGNTTLDAKITSKEGEIGGWTINDNSLSTDNITLLSDDYGQIRCKTDDFYALLYDGKYIFGVWDEANPYQAMDKQYVDISAKGLYARGSDTTGYLFEINNDKDTVTVYSTTDDKALSVINFGTGNTLYLQNAESSYSNAALRAYVVHDYVYEDDEGNEQIEKRSAYVSLFGEKENGRIVFRTDLGGTTTDYAYEQYSTIGTTNFRWGSGYFGKLYTDSGSITDSDAKVKTIVDELDNELALTFINNLKPTEYYYNNSNNQRVHMGFIAQEVNKVAKDLDMGNMSLYEAVKVDENGKEYYYSDEYDDEELKWSLNYTEFIAPLVGAVQALTKRVEDLEADNEKLRTRIEKLEDASE